ncbi:MAG: carboxypeptidase regulatory-like domain-containing protein [Vicinamibacterales bacterium]
MRKVLLVLMLVFVVSSSAAAQEQRASVEGTIRDASGGVLPGVTVEARSPALVGAAVAITDANGAYRFPALAPGRYELTASLTGFQTTKQSNVVLELGQILKVDLTLGVGGVSETVQVRAEAPLIDVKQNAAGANVSQEIIDRIPKGRDFTTLVTSAPGINDESRNRGLQIDGGSGADNRFMVDGVDTTDLRLGTTNKSVAPDFIKEVQVKASGYSAEYRASIGGVVSAITKTGSNEFHGGGGVYFTNEGLQGDIRPTLRLNPRDQTQAEYVQTPPDAWYNADVVADLGGPIYRDRLWFYVGYNPLLQETKRTVVFNDNKAAGPQTFSSKPFGWTLNSNVSGQVSPNLRGKFAVSTYRLRGGLGLPGINTDGTSNSNSKLFPAVVRNDSYNDTYSGVIDWVLSGTNYINITTTYHRYGYHDVGQFSDKIIHSFSGSNFQFPEIPAALQQVSGFADNRSSNRQVRDNFSHFNVNADATRFVSWKGQHTLKAGIQVERIANDVLSGAQQPTVTLYWNASYGSTSGQFYRGTYGYYNVSRFYTTGNVHANNIGLFVQDSWTVNRKLTLNLGLRTEKEDVPAYREGTVGFKFGFGQKLAPRLGFAYDVGGDSRWKAYGSWGMFYDLMKLGMGRVMFGAENWMNYYFTLDTYDWPSIGGAYPPAPGTSAYPGRFIEQLDYRPLANDPNFNLIDPDLHSIRMQEFTLGLDHELSKTMSVGARFVHKWVDYAIEAVCRIIDGQEYCGVNNPGFGPAEFPIPGMPRQPKAVRNYDGLEVRLRKRYADRWSLDASYLRSRLWGNWSGIASSDEAVSSLQPYAGRAFDLLYYSYDSKGQVTKGVLATDRPHQLKVQGTYDLPWGTMVGLNYSVQSGTPRSTVINQNNIGFFPYGRGNLGRYPVLSRTDLLLQQEFALPGKTKVSVGMNVVNLFDQKTVTSINVNPYRDGFYLSDAEFFAGFDPKAYAASHPIRVNPLYQLANGYASRRVIRVQAKFTF